MTTETLPRLADWLIETLPSSSDASRVQEIALGADWHQPIVGDRFAHAVECNTFPHVTHITSFEVPHAELRKELTGNHVAVGEDVQATLQGQTPRLVLGRSVTAKDEVFEVGTV
jgi:hypothetical protein